MASVSVDEAEAKLSVLLIEVERGREAVITREGKPVARLVPVIDVRNAQTLADDLLEIRQELQDRGQRFTWAELKAYRDEGRR